MATAEGVKEAFEFLKDQLPMTPIQKSSTLDAMVGCEVLFKAEHLQKTGSYKTRGALYNVHRLKEQGVKGVITFSTGNHGQAVAWAAKKNGLACTVVMLTGTPESKVNAVLHYGAVVLSCEDIIERCARLSIERGLSLIEPFDADATICGQGTVAEELKIQLGDDIPALFVSVGGGGLCAGLALSLPVSTKLYLVEPEHKHLSEQLDGTYDGDRGTLKTVADGIRVRMIGQRNIKILNARGNKEIVTVSDDEIREALILIWTRLKQHVEPTAALAFAGLRKVVAATPVNISFKKAVVILSGGNVDPSFVP